MKYLSRFLSGILFPCLMAVSLAAGDQDQVASTQRDRAVSFVAGLFGENSPEHDRFSQTAKVGSDRHTETEGTVKSFFDDYLTVDVSVPLDRVVEYRLINCYKRAACHPDDLKRFSTDPEDFQDQLKRLLRLTAPDVSLARLSDPPHFSGCWDGSRLSSLSWSLPRNERGESVGLVKVEIKFDLLSREVLGFRVQVAGDPGSVRLSADDCRQLVSEKYRHLRSLTIEQLTLANIFSSADVLVPVWAVNVSADNGFGGRWGTICNIHANTGEFLEDPSTYEGRR